MGDRDTPPGQVLEISFDPAGLKGSNTHYFHFLHGFLLPGLHLALAGGPGRGGLRFADCGPVMQPRVKEACALLGVGYVPPEEGAGPGGQAVLAPRWDRILLHGDAPPPPGRARRAYRQTCAPLRQALLRASHAACARSGSLDRWRGLDVIVFRRAEEPAWYLSPEMAQWRGYGRGRRDFVNGAEMAGICRARGLRAEHLDLSELSFADQIMACRHASAVIGVRGAEFANLFWMKQGALALMLATPIRRENNGSRCLARIFGQDFLAHEVAGPDVRLSSPEMGCLADLLAAHIGAGVTGRD